MNELAVAEDRTGDRGVIDLMLAHVPAGMSASETELLRVDAEKRFVVQQRTALSTFADRLAEREPIILRSTDTVRSYAQTDAGRAACLPADHVRGLDALAAELFAGDPAGAGGGDQALHGNASAPAS